MLRYTKYIKQIKMADGAGVFVREIECKEGVLEIKQSEIGDVGCVVWDAALVLGKYLQTQHFLANHRLENKRVVELGAGTGALGLIAATMGADVVGTDLEDFVPLMDTNKDTNQHLIIGSFAAKVLNWGQDVSSFLPHPDYVLVADCIYYEKSLSPLAKTLCDLCSNNTVVLLSYEERTTGNKPLIEKRFFELVDKWFTRDEIPLEKQDAVFRSSDIHILQLRKRGSRR